LKRKAGLLAALVLVLTLGPMWAFVLDEIKHERTLTVQAARNNAMNLATAFEAHVLSTIRLMDIVLLDMREDVLGTRTSAATWTRSSRPMAASLHSWR